MEIDKIASYVGFSIKSRQMVIGTDNILKSKKVKFVLCKDSLSENASKKLKSKFDCYTFSQSDFERIVPLSGVQALGLTSEQLTKSIKNLLGVQ